MLALGLLFGACPGDQHPARDTGGAESSTGDAGPDGSTRPRLIILHTNDLHANVEGWGPTSEYTPGTTGDDGTYGGFARIAAVVAGEKSTAGGAPVLLLDAGDFSMGSLFDWLAPTDHATLALMEQIGYDAIALGNHELDWNVDGLAVMLDSASAAGFKVPILASNLQLSTSDPRDDKLEALAQAGVLVRKVVRTLSNGLRVGLFSVVGKDAASIAFGAAPATFEEAAATAAALVQELRQQDHVDVVICVSHSGIQADGSGEDSALAASVPGIDVIVSGHSHTALAQPVVETTNGTIIVQAGAHGRYLGRLELDLADGKVTLANAALLSIDDSVLGDGALQTAVDGYIKKIDGLLAAAVAGLTYRKALVETTFDITFPKYQETILGNILTDAYLVAAKALEPGQPPDIALDSGGTIDNEVLKGKHGKLLLADFYRTCYSGFGPDRQASYPLVSFYLAGKDLKNAMELTAHAESPLGSNAYFLQVSNLQLEYSQSGTEFDKVTSIKVGSPAVAVDLTASTPCYKVVTNYALALHLAYADVITSGALSVVPKEKDCQTVITDMAGRIIDRDPAASGVQELKPWQAVAIYLSKMPDTDKDGTPDLPSSYASLQDRIVVQP